MSAFQRISSFQVFPKIFSRFLWVGWLPKNPKSRGDPFPLDPMFLSVVTVTCHCNSFDTNLSLFCVFKKVQKNNVQKVNPVRDSNPQPLGFEVQRAIHCANGAWFDFHQKRNETMSGSPVQKRIPRPGIEPGSSAWQAEILTSILPRIQSSLWFNFAHQNGLKWAQKRRKCTKIREQKMNRSRQDLNLRGQSPMDF